MERRAGLPVWHDPGTDTVQTLGSTRDPDAFSAIMTHSCATYAPLMRRDASRRIRDRGDMPGGAFTLDDPP
jgi:hypothetical protein